MMLIVLPGRDRGYSNFILTSVSFLGEQVRMAYQHLTFNFLAGIIGRSFCWLVFAGTYIYRSMHLFLALLLDRSLVQLYIQPLEVQKTVWFVKTASLLE